MQSVIYDVAVSADGFICDANEDVSRFPHSGPMVDAYVDRLGTYAVAVMGATTYNFGLKHGLQPGANPYPSMRTIVFSKSLESPPNSEVEFERSDAKQSVRRLKESATGPIYLCGGAKLAATLVQAGLVDRIRLKRAPILLGSGTPLFAELARAPELELAAQVSYPDGALFQEFTVR